MKTVMFWPPNKTPREWRKKIFTTLALFLSPIVSAATALDITPTLNAAVNAGVGDNVFHSSVRSPGEDVIMMPGKWSHRYDMRASESEKFLGTDPLAKAHNQAIIQSPMFDTGEIVQFVAWGGESRSPLSSYLNEGFISTYIGDIWNQYRSDERVNGGANFYKGAKFVTTPCYHPSSIAILPAQKAPSGRPNSAFVFIAAEHCSATAAINNTSDRILIQKYTPSFGQDGSWTTVGTMQRPPGKKNNLVMINYDAGLFWLVMGSSSGDVDIYSASPSELLPPDGTLNVGAWRLHWSATLDSRTLYGNTSLLKYNNGLWFQGFERNNDLSGSDYIHITKFDPFAKTAEYYNQYKQILPDTRPGGLPFENPNFAAGVSAYITEQGKWIAAVIPHYSVLDSNDLKYWFHPELGWDASQF